MNQDAGTHFSRCRHPSLKTQAQDHNLLAYPSRCRFNAQIRYWLCSLDAGPKDVTPIVVAMLWSNRCNHLRSIYQLLDRRKRTEKLRIYCNSSDNQALRRFWYSVALRFQTTDGCSSSSAIKETIFINQSKNNITETFDATSFVSDLFSFPFFPSVVNLFWIFVK